MLYANVPIGNIGTIKNYTNLCLEILNEARHKFKNRIEF